METLLSDFYIQAIQSSKDTSIEPTSVLLWVLHADKIPPHIGISVKGNYFSLKANGKDDMLPISKIKETIEKKKITTLCFELADSIELENVCTSFGQYSRTIPEKITCLKPINEILKLESCKQLTESLTALYDNNRISRVIGFNINSDFEGIKQYEIDDIHARLQQLKNKFG